MEKEASKLPPELERSESDVSMDSLVPFDESRDDDAADELECSPGESEKREESDDNIASSALSTISTGLETKMLENNNVTREVPSVGVDGSQQNRPDSDVQGEQEGQLAVVEASDDEGNGTDGEELTDAELGAREDHSKNSDIITNRDGNAEANENDGDVVFNVDPITDGGKEKSDASTGVDLDPTISSNDRSEVQADEQGNDVEVETHKIDITNAGIKSDSKCEDEGQAEAHCDVERETEHQGQIGKEEVETSVHGCADTSEDAKVSSGTQGTDDTHGKDETNIGSTKEDDSASNIDPQSSQKSEVQADEQGNDVEVETNEVDVNNAAVESDSKCEDEGQAQASCSADGETEHQDQIGKEEVEISAAGFADTSEDTKVSSGTQGTDDTHGKDETNIGSTKEDDSASNDDKLSRAAAAFQEDLARSDLSRSTLIKRHPEEFIRYWRDHRTSEQTLVFFTHIPYYIMNLIKCDQEASDGAQKNKLYTALGMVPRETVTFDIIDEEGGVEIHHETFEVNDGERTLVVARNQRVAILVCEKANQRVQQRLKEIISSHEEKKKVMGNQCSNTEEQQDIHAEQAVNKKIQEDIPKESKRESEPTVLSVSNDDVIEPKDVSSETEADTQKTKSGESNAGPEILEKPMATKKNTFKLFASSLSTFFGTSSTDKTSLQENATDDQGEKISKDNQLNPQRTANTEQRYPTVVTNSTEDTHEESQSDDRDESIEREGPEASSDRDDDAKKDEKADSPKVSEVSMKQSFMSTSQELSVDGPELSIVL